MDHLDGLEEHIEQLKVAYERYFNGVDRIPPAREHDAVKASVRNLARMRSGSTSVRFRAQNLKARLVTYEHYWTRILVQIEKGTFKRVLAVSRRREFEVQQQKRLEQDAPQPSQSGVWALVQAQGQAPVKPKPEPDAPRGPAARSSSGRVLPEGLDASEARALFKQFVAAKKAAGEPIAGLTYGRLIDKLANEVPKLQEKHGGSIRFEVSTAGGKVRLRARRRGGDPA